MRWIEALREWNAKHNPGKWCIPRKGSEEMAQVRAIMGAAAPKAAAEPKAKGPRVRAAVKKIEEKMSELEKEELETMKALEEKRKARAAPKKKTIGEMRAEKRAAKAPAAPKKTIGEMRAEKKAGMDVRDFFGKSAVKAAVKEAVNEHVEAPKTQRDKIIEMISTELVAHKEPEKREAPSKKAASRVDEKLGEAAKERGYRYKRFDELQVGDMILRKKSDGEEIALLVEEKTPLTATVSGKGIDTYKMKSSKKIIYKVLV